MGEIEIIYGMLVMLTTRLRTVLFGKVLFGKNKIMEVLSFSFVEDWCYLSNLPLNK